MHQLEYYSPLKSTVTLKLKLEVEITLFNRSYMNYQVMPLPTSRL